MSRRSSRRSTQRLASSDWQVAASRSTHRLKVLLEVGVQAGRTGVRTAQEARTVLQAIVAIRRAWSSRASPASRASWPVDRGKPGMSVCGIFLAFMREVAAFVAPAAAAQGSSELILSGGGSIHFLTVAEELSRPIGTEPARSESSSAVAARSRMTTSDMTRIHHWDRLLRPGNPACDRLSRSGLRSSRLRSRDWR